MMHRYRRAIRGPRRGSVWREECTFQPIQLLAPRSSTHARAKCAVETWTGKSIVVVGAAIGNKDAGVPDDKDCIYTPIERAHICVMYCHLVPAHRAGALAKRMVSTVAVSHLPSRKPSAWSATAHHVGQPPTAFKNPWPSFKQHSLGLAFKLRFGSNSEKNFVPVPQNADGTRSDELVKIRRPDWGASKKDRLRATWIGHASFLMETPAAPGAERGIRIL